ncbi:hypothetical protein DXG01_013814 [Tephrocybe rancida]|nr:hypothetical protein DXG01_013814 [Tephrocybe rancida]
MATQSSTQQPSPSFLAPLPPIQLHKTPAELAEERWGVITAHLIATGAIDIRHPTLMPSAFTPIPASAAARARSSISASDYVAVTVHEFGLSLRSQNDAFVAAYNLRLQKLRGEFVSTLVLHAVKQAQLYYSVYGTEGFSTFAKTKLVGDAHVENITLSGCLAPIVTTMAPSSTSKAARPSRVQRLANTIVSGFGNTVIVQNLSPSSPKTLGSSQASAARTPALRKPKSAPYLVSRLTVPDLASSSRLPGPPVRLGANDPGRSDQTPSVFTESESTIMIANFHQF